MVFGKDTGFDAEINLSSLLATNGGDGSAGFVLNGIDAGDRSGVSVSTAGDVNGDGKADLVWRETNTGDVGAWLMNGLSTPTTGVIAGAVPLVWEIQ